MNHQFTIKIKRVYEAPSQTDGYRVLIDRLWPRGLSKEKAALDEWAKDLAPSTELRKWFAHQPERFVEFESRYRDELKNFNHELQRLLQLSAAQNLSILYAAKDEQHNNAVVLLKLLKELS